MTEDSLWSLLLAICIFIFFTTFMNKYFKDDI